MTRNVVQFRRFFGGMFLAVSVVVALLALFGCGNPWVIHRSVTLAGDADVNGTLTAGEIEVDHLEADSAEIGGVIISDGNITVPGTVTAEEVIQIPPPPQPPPAPVCGNWIVETGEQCDRLNFGGQTCLGYDDFVGGSLVCAADCKIKFDQSLRPPPPPPPLAPALLTVVLLSDNGNDHFPVGADVKLTIYTSGGEAPYDYRCQWVDGTFSIADDSPNPKFSLKIINSPGTGMVTCRVTSADGQEAIASFVIYVQ